MKKILFLLATSLCVTSPTLAELKVGSAAPKIKAQSDQNKLWDSSKFLNKKYIVLFFYPANMTGG